MSACFTFDGYRRATNILIELFSSCPHFCYTVRRSNESDATIVIVPVYVASITKEILPSLSIDERTTNERENSFSPRRMEGSAKILLLC